MPDQETTSPITPRRDMLKLSNLSPNRLLIIISVSIFFAEMVDMLLLDILPPLNSILEALLDSCILLVILSPVYFFLYRPFWQERQRAEAEIRRLTRQLIRTEEATRKVLARDLHDEFGQTLGAMQLGVETLKNSLPTGHEPLAAQCQRLSGMIAHLGAHVRDVTAQLRPAMLDNLGLVPTLHWHLQQFSLHHPEVCVIIDINEQRSTLTAEVALAVYRVCQESLNNVIKHARANQVKISLRHVNGQGTLVIQDNGMGFAADRRREADSEHPPGIGISGMRERIADIGGSLQIVSRPGSGTRVTASFPLGEETVP